MRRDFVEGGAAVLILMLVGYIAIGAAQLPSNLSNLFLVVTGIGAVILVLGFFLKEPARHGLITVENPPSPDQWACSRCGTINPGTSSFCGKCGQARTSIP